MSITALIDGHVSEKQCNLAVDALLNHARKVEEKKAETQLLPGKEQNAWLVVTVKHMQPEKKLKPSRIPIAHPLVDPRTSSVCLITKDPQREYKDLLESHNIRFISRVVGVEKLKGKFKPFEARRLLLKENDLFLADERVIPLLPGLLGRKFFEAKKQPIPVSLTKKDLKSELERAISATYFHQNQGTCVSVKIGTLSQKPSQILDNLKMALPAVVKKVKGEWDNIQSFHIKTNSSASLPLWSCELGGGEGGRWDGLTVGAASEEERSQSPFSEVEEDKPKTTAAKSKVVAQEAEKRKKAGKGTKRAAEDEMTKPPKKAKADEAVEAIPETTEKRKVGAKDVKMASKLQGDGKKAASTTTTMASSSSISKPPKRPAAAAGDASVSKEEAPTTPLATRKKAARASAADFLEDESPASIPSVPPNTPADGSASGKKKRRSKATEATPISSAIDKLTAKSAATTILTHNESATPETPLPKAKGRKSASGEASAAKPESKTSSQTIDMATPTKDQLKKKRSAAAGEKKKDKTVNSLPAAKTAKSAVVGKKRH